MFGRAIFVVDCRRPGALGLPAGAGFPCPGSWPVGMWVWGQAVTGGPVVGHGCPTTTSPGFIRQHAATAKATCPDWVRSLLATCRLAAMSILPSTSGKPSGPRAQNR